MAPVKLKQLLGCAKFKRYISMCLCAKWFCACGCSSVCWTLRVLSPAPSYNTRGKVLIRRTLWLPRYVGCTQNSTGVGVVFRTMLSFTKIIKDVGPGCNKDDEIKDESMIDKAESMGRCYDGPTYIKDRLYNAGHIISQAESTRVRQWSTSECTSRMKRFVLIVSIVVSSRCSLVSSVVGDNQQYRCE